jgi:hypothetical protein
MLRKEKTTDQTGMMSNISINLLRSDELNMKNSQDRPIRIVPCNGIVQNNV